MSMRHKTLVAVCAMILAAPGLGFAQTESADSRWQKLDPETRDALMSEWDQKSPEEQDAIKQRARDKQAKWKSMTPEQQQQAKAHHQAAADKWKTMTDEEKNAARKRYKEQHADQAESSD